ncbi:MAG: hypothetical protein FLDDKLPJ_00250 [Phycisphaerae bacterium]|nr:hypothetical protein [Phycisphaerae bacterium]
MTELLPRLTVNPRSRGFRWTTGALAVVILAQAFRSLEFELTFAPAGQWDFESYYYALHAYRNGENPYDPDSLKAIAQHAVFPFAYPHHTLAFFALFDRGQIEASKKSFLLAKFAVLAALLLVWTFRLVPRGARGWFLGFVALGLNAAAPRDLTAGNVSLFEILPIWLGVAALSAGHPALFCAGVILGAQFKLQPLLLLGLLWFTDAPRRAVYFGASIAAVALIGAGVYLHDPAAATAYAQNSTRIAGGEAGLSNPSLLKLLTQSAVIVMEPYDVFEGVERRTVGRAVYPIVALGIIFLTFRTLPASRRDPRWIHLGVVTYALVAPRMKDYSWVIVLPSVFELARLALRRPATLVPAAVLAFIFLAAPMRDAMWTYRPYVLTFLIWTATVFAPVPVESEGEPATHESETDVRGSPAAP